jgi:hypothetical protein
MENIRRDIDIINEYDIRNELITRLDIYQYDYNNSLNVQCIINVLKTLKKSDRYANLHIKIGNYILVGGTIFSLIYWGAIFLIMLLNNLEGNVLKDSLIIYFVCLMITTIVYVVYTLVLFKFIMKKLEKLDDKCYLALDMLSTNSNISV